MLNLAATVPLTQAATAAGLPIGTLASWRNRGHVQRGAMTVADVMSLCAAQRLMNIGMSIEDAASVAQAIKPEWPHIIVHGGSLYLLISRTAQGEPVSWDIVTGDRLRHKFEPTAIYTSLSSVAREVLGKLRDHLQEPAGHG